MYIATIALSLRRNRWGYFIGFSAAGSAFSAIPLNAGSGRRSDVSQQLVGYLQVPVESQQVRRAANAERRQFRERNAALQFHAEFPQRRNEFRLLNPHPSLPHSRGTPCPATP